jgi:hypothetical protein
MVETFKKEISGITTFLNSFRSEVPFSPLDVSEFYSSQLKIYSSLASLDPRSSTFVSEIVKEYSKRQLKIDSELCDIPLSDYLHILPSFTSPSYCFRSPVLKLSSDIEKYVTMNDEEKKLALIDISTNLHFLDFFLSFFSHNDKNYRDFFKRRPEESKEIQRFVERTLINLTIEDLI